MKYLGDSFDLHAGGEDLTFPHHENEIAQSESLTGKTFSRHWMHVRFLLVEGEKMSKSLGNFYTLRDLLIKGHKPSAIRFLLTSVPYRKQLNFTFAGLEQGAKSVERLRTFDARIRMAQLPAGTNPVAQEAAAKAKSEMRAGMEDDLNMAYASGAIFDMVREANILADQGELREGDKAPLLEALQQFDEIFAVIKDDDAEKTKAAMEWARSHGILKDSDIPADAMSDPTLTALSRNATPPKKPATSPAQTRFVNNWPTQESWWRIRKRESGGKGSESIRPKNVGTNKAISCERHFHLLILSTDFCFFPIACLPRTSLASIIKLRRCKTFPVLP